MRHSVYRYNTDTCRYERVRIAPRDVITYILGVLVMAVAMLAGLLFLHDFVFDSENEVALRKENAALTRNSIVLTHQLNDIESTLATLHAEDKRLHQKFFGVELVEAKMQSTAANKQQLLLADPSAFSNAVKLLKEHSSSLLDQSSKNNIYFGNSIEISKDDVASLNAMPSAPPIQPWESEKLISGFGMRINPFHKGLYEHAGVDIALPRGTFVRTTADGTVTLIRTSDLQAGYGNYIEVDHGYGFVTRYAHLQDINVRYGQKIKKGFVIGTIGSSGGSVAPHLHYEILFKGKNVDPVLFMIEGLSSHEHFALKNSSQKQNQSLD